MITCEEQICLNLNLESVTYKRRRDSVVRAIGHDAEGFESGLGKPAIIKFCQISITWYLFPNRRRTRQLKKKDWLSYAVSKMQRSSKSLLSIRRLCYGKPLLFKYPYKAIN